MLMEPVNALSRLWPCACLKCVSGLRRLEKTLSFLRCIHVFYLVLKYVSDINEGIRLQFLFYVIVLIGAVDSVIGMSLFQLCFRFSIEVFSYCTLTGTFALGFQKFFDHEWIDFVFLLENGFFSLTYYLYGLKGLKSARISQLFFFDDIIFFVV